VDVDELYVLEGKKLFVSCLCQKRDIFFQIKNEMIKNKPFFSSISAALSCCGGALAEISIIGICVCSTNESENQQIENIYFFLNKKKSLNWGRTEFFS
jgi:hypothetical protein